MLSFGLWLSLCSGSGGSAVELDMRCIFTSYFARILFQWHIVLLVIKAITLDYLQSSMSTGHLRFHINHAVRTTGLSSLVRHKWVPLWYSTWVWAVWAVMHASSLSTDN